MKTIFSSPLFNVSRLLKYWVLNTGLLFDSFFLLHANIFDLIVLFVRIYNKELQTTDDLANTAETVDNIGYVSFVFLKEL